MPLAFGLPPFAATTITELDQQNIKLGDRTQLASVMAWSRGRRVHLANVLQHLEPQKWIPCVLSGAQRSTEPGAVWYLPRRGRRKESAELPGARAGHCGASCAVCLAAELFRAQAAHGHGNQTVQKSRGFELLGNVFQR